MSFGSCCDQAETSLPLFATAQDGAMEVLAAAPSGKERVTAFVFGNLLPLAFLVATVAVGPLLHIGMKATNAACSGAR